MQAEFQAQIDTAQKNFMTMLGTNSQAGIGKFNELTGIENTAETDEIFGKKDDDSNDIYSDLTIDDLRSVWDSQFESARKKHSDNEQYMTIINAISSYTTKFFDAIETFMTNSKTALETIMGKMKTTQEEMSKLTNK